MEVHRRGIRDYARERHGRTHVCTWILVVVQSDVLNKQRDARVRFYKDTLICIDFIKYTFHSLVTRHNIYSLRAIAFLKNDRDNVFLRKKLSLKKYDYLILFQTVATKEKGMNSHAYSVGLSHTHIHTHDLFSMPRYIIQRL